MDDTNYKIAKNIATAAKNVGVSRMIHVSALGAREDAISEFGRSKWAGEQAVKAVFPEATILRPSTLFGYEDNLLVKWAGILKFWPVVPLVEEIIGTKEAPISAMDLSYCIQNCIFNLRTVGKTYELQGAKIITTKELIDIVRQATYLPTQEKNVNYNLLKFVASISEKVLRKPRFTADELVFRTQDNLVSPGSLGVADLGIKPENIEDMALRFIRHYRRPKFINEI